MKNWFNSLDGAITLSTMALLAELWRAFVDFQNEYSNFLSGTGQVLIATLIYTALFAGWAWVLVRAMHGSRSGLIAALIINLLFLLVLPIGSLVSFCPSPCSELWPAMELANWINLVFGLLAAATLAVQLFQPGHATQESARR